jgi:lipopolysaccharide biosynthesis glycosyltransferase
MAVSNPITFVCIVESGPLEVQAIRMVSSLRRWGGQFANAPVLAVTPRFGPPIARSTAQAFEALQVQYIRSHEKSNYPWFPYLNKPACLVVAERHTDSEQIAYLDADLLIVGEPNQLILQEQEGFVACTPDQIGGTTGTDDPLEPFWQEACKTLGMNIEDLPWVRTEQEGVLIRLYWNGGVFAYRRSTGFAQQYLNTAIQLLDSKTLSQKCDVFFHEQIGMSLAVGQLGIQWRGLPYSYNYGMNSKTHDSWYSESRLKAAQIIHYHDSMWPQFWPVFMECMVKTHPHVADWLSSIGPMKNEAPLPYRSMSKVLKHFRNQQESAYKKLCKVI